MSHAKPTIAPHRYPVVTTDCEYCGEVAEGFARPWKCLSRGLLEPHTCYACHDRLDEEEQEQHDRDLLRAIEEEEAMPEVRGYYYWND